MKKKIIFKNILIYTLLITISIITIYFGYTMTQQISSAPKESPLGDFPIIYLC